MPLTAPDPIQTERLCVRLLDEADLPALLEVNASEEVTAMLPYARWTSMDDARAWFERMAGIQATGTALQFVIASRSTGAAIGTCLLFRHDVGSGRAELGYVIGRSFWGQGLMREALTGLLASAFGAMGLRRLEAEVDPRNTPSSGLLRRLGFTREGLLRRRWIVKGTPRDVEIFGLLSDEWPAGREQVAA